MNQAVGISFNQANSIRRRIRAADYLTVAELFLIDNFLLERPLAPDDVKSRLLGHWGTCHGINVAYANLKYFYKKNPDFQFVLGPGHGFPALNANLFIDGELEKVDENAKRNEFGIEYLCKNFSFPGGFPSHSSPLTPGIITEGGELGYALGSAYGVALGHPEKTIAVLLGDGEFETGTALASLNLSKLIAGESNGRVLPILSVNGYKISGPTVFARKSDREQLETVRGFGFDPIVVEDENPEMFQVALSRAESLDHPFILFRNEKGHTGPLEVNGNKVAGNYLAHQIPLPHAKTDETELSLLEEWLKSYEFNELFSKEKGFNL
ncbi:hypothetical protein IKG20_00945 [Candidatus Saccharibacteria bacterium]|nr:hypothetical protein [Candidatus Saccharibacteria bacterium]